jgi:hypothetical protein
VPTRISHKDLILKTEIHYEFLIYLKI